MSYNTISEMSLNTYNIQDSEFNVLALNLQIHLVIELFKEQDPDNYFMYRLNGLDDYEIFKIITAPSIIDLWDMDCEDLVEEY